MAYRTYQSRLRLAGGLALGGGILAGLIGGRIARLVPPGENFWFVFPALAGVVALAMAATVPWWRKLDDMQKQAHLISWYWGGIWGAGLVLMALIAATGVKSDLSSGALYLFLGQGAGFGLYWLAWQWSHRGREA